MKVAIVHDYLTQRGGAERVVLSLLRLFPDADLYTSVYDADGTYPEFEAYDVRTTPLQRLMKPGRDVRHLLPLLPWAFGSIELRGYDLVVSSSSGFAHGVRVLDGSHLCYCHNPPRWLYQIDEYLADGAAAPPSSRPLLAPLLAWMRRWDQRAAERPHQYVANSGEVASRIAEVYGRDAEVIHPPVDAKRIIDGAREMIEGDPYVLVVSRLLPYKRVDLVIDACRRLGIRLIVVGDGPARESLRLRGTGDVEFRTRVSDAELNGLLHGCTMLVQAGAEDFGLAPLEANAAGRPGIAYAAGGALETVVDGKTGLLVYEPSPEAFAAAIEQACGIDWAPNILRAHALAFGEERYFSQMRAVVGRLV